MPTGAEFARRSRVFKTHLAHGKGQNRARWQHPINLNYPLARLNGVPIPISSPESTPAPPMAFARTDRQDTGDGRLRASASGMIVVAM